MLQVRLLGQFDIRADGKPISIPSRAGQSLFAYLILNASTPYRREKLAGLIWPDTSDENARRNLRQELWRIRRALANVQSTQVEYILAQEISLAFNAQADYWLDVTALEQPPAAEESSSDLASRLTLYRGELLPGFYDDWAVLERDRLHGVFEHRMQKLMQCLIREQRWTSVLEWCERWIAFGQTPEPAYRALMVAFAALGDKAKVVATFERCKAALEKELGVEAAEETQALCDQLTRGDAVPNVDLTSTQVAATHRPLFDEPAAPGEPPFKGLQYFDESDSEWFFGREMVTAKLVGHLRSHQFLAVIIGASGSGKSSLVRAGLIPALRRGQALTDGTLPTLARTGWQVHILTPTAHPLEALAVALTRDAESVTATATLLDDLARDPRALRLYSQKSARPSGHVLVVIDQFEELFTLCRDEFERQAFIDNLLAVLPGENELGRSDSRPRAGVTLVIALRADFYAHLAQYEELRDAVAAQQEYIGPMTTEELRRAIEEPAQRGQWQLEPGLVDLILRDVGSEPGALPLLSHALLETWKRRRGRMLTLKGYAESGGVRGAIAQTAETVYAQLTPDEQAIARNIFLRLTELGEGTEDTRRRATFAELIPRTENAATVRAVLNRMADARLMTLGKDTAEVAHEALIREWTTLREWLAQDREGLRLHRHLTQAAQEWELLERDPGSLYRGARLAQAREWASINAERLNELENAFLDASSKQEEREQAEREAQRQRELQAAQRLAEEQQRRAEVQEQASRQLRRRARFLAGSFVLAIVLAGIALFFGDEARTSAVTAQAASRVATARELAASAVSNVDSDPELGLLLALQSVSTTYSIDQTTTKEAVESLHRAVQAQRVVMVLSGHSDGLTGVVYSPDGKRIAAASWDKTVKVWDASSGKELLTLSGHTDKIWGVVYSPDGKRLATSSDDQTVKVWDASTGKELMTLSGHTGTVGNVVFSPDGTRLASASADGTARVWDANSGRLLLTVTVPQKELWGIAYSPDGAQLATGTQDGSTKIWDANSGTELMTLPADPVHHDVVRAIAYSADGKRIATAAEGLPVIWDALTGKKLVQLPEQDNFLYGIAFSPDGARVATADGDKTVRIWDSTTGSELLTLYGGYDCCYGLAYSPDGSRVIGTRYGGTALVWDTGPGRELFTITGHQGTINNVLYSPDGTRLATASFDGTAKLWDAQTGQELMTLAGHKDRLFGLAFSPDGKRIATASGDADRTAKIWDVATGKALVTLTGHGPTLPYPFATFLNGVLDVAFSPDGAKVATAGGDGTARVWDAFTGKELLTIPAENGAVLLAVSFSSDGRLLATAGTDMLAKLWDATTGNLVRTLPGHKGYVQSVAFSPDGKRLATAGADATVKLWDVATGKELLTLSGHTSGITGVTWDRAGARLVTASTDQTAKIWDAATGKELLTLTGHHGRVARAVFSPDSTRLATSSDDISVRVYLLRIQDLIPLAQSRITRWWTPVDCQKYLHVDQCPPQP